MFQAFLNTWQKNQQSAVTVIEEKKEEAPSLKASTFEKQILKTLCGLPRDIDDSSLPKWYLDLFGKNQDDKDRDQIVAEVLTSTLRFKDAEIPVYPELKKIILKRNWVGGKAGSKPKYAYMCYGITPFAMMDLLEDQIAQMEFDSQFIADSSTITPSELKALKQKLIAKVPMDGAKWKAILLKFTNLLFILFKGKCPLYTKMLDIAKAIRKYPAEVLDKNPMHAKASVLWVIHLQASHFAQGKMDPRSPTTMCLPAFKLMYNQICSTAVHMVSIAGLPAKLEYTPTPDLKRKHEPKPLDPEAGQPDQKKGKPSKEKKEAPWNTLLKDALENPLKVAGNPSLKAIARHCNLLRDDMIIPILKWTTADNGCCLANVALAKHVASTTSQHLMLRHKLLSLNWKGSLMHQINFVKVSTSEDSIKVNIDLNTMHRRLSLLV